jgi:hypothetical protein
MRSPLVQNDDQLVPAIQKAGCLFRSLAYGAEAFIANKTGKSVGPLTADQINELYRRLVEIHKHREWNGMAENCFVYGHTDVIEQTGELLGYPLNAFYIASVAYDESRAKPYNSAMEVLPNFWITHRSLLNGTGHFMVANADRTLKWDPFFPATTYSSEISFRVYRIESKEGGGRR